MGKAKALVALLLLAATPLFGQSVTVNWTNTHQTMDGWGAEDWISNQNGYQFTPAQADLFFSPSAGIGLEYIRTQNYACPTTGPCGVSTSNVPDLVSLQEAVARGAKIELNVQPPANLQYGENFVAGTPGPSGNCVDSANWPALADFTVRWIQMLNSNGAPVSVLSVANEPDLDQPDSLGGCVWTAGGLDGYISGYLGPALASAGLSSVRVMLAEASNWFDTDLVSVCLNDASCSKYVSIAAGHGYRIGGIDGTNNGYCCHTAVAPPSSTAGKHIWMSEVNGGSTYNSTAHLWKFDSSMTDALVWAHSIHDYLTAANVSGWNYWQLADCCAGTSGAPFNDGLTDASFHTSKRYYVIGNWSRYVRAGWVRIDATSNPASETFVTAFKDPSSANFAIVAVNRNTSPVNVAFSLADFPSVTSLTPTLTSASAGLADQPVVSVSDGAFSYSLPPLSVVTFHTASSSNSSQPPAPPSNLTARVQ
jgi:glucuronoarabinoxylan endo-1,4-beta-xylanase